MLIENMACIGYIVEPHYGSGSTLNIAYLLCLDRYSLINPEVQLHIW